MTRLQYDYYTTAFPKPQVMNRRYGTTLHIIPIGMMRRPELLAIAKPEETASSL